MKTLITSFVISVFAAPAAVALFLIFRFLASHVPDLYFAFASLALAFSISTMVWGPFWLEPVSSASFWVLPKFRQRTNSIQEKKYEKYFKGQVRS
jgi:NO-binding membrane sensor protein with MHYT domain